MADIRPATADDAEIIHALIQAMSAEMAVGKTAASTPEDFRRHADVWAALIAWDATVPSGQTVPVGLCLYFPSFSSWRGRAGIYIQDLYVAPAARGTGLARTLLAEAARRTDAAYMRLSVDRSNAAALRFYAREGMTLADEERIHVIEGAALARLKGENR